jgi:hypothetical protein
MGTKHVAVAVAAAAATLFATPAFSQSFGELRSPMTGFFVAVPLDGATRKEQQMNFGLQFQGLRPYQAVRVDYTTFKLLGAGIAGLEAKYIIAGAIAVGAAVAVARQDKGKSESFAAAQAQQQEECPQVC